MEHIVVTLAILTLLFGAIEPKQPREEIPYVRHISEFFEADYFEGVEL